jgi:hypothetical protein
MNTAAAIADDRDQHEHPAEQGEARRRKIRFSTGIGRVKSPSRERPASDAEGGSFGLGIEVVRDRLTWSLSQERSLRASWWSVSRLRRGVPLSARSAHGSVSVGSSQLR